MCRVLSALSSHSSSICFFFSRKDRSCLDKPAWPLHIFCLFFSPGTPKNIKIIHVEKHQSFHRNKAAFVSRVLSTFFHSVSSTRLLCQAQRPVDCSIFVIYSTMKYSILAALLITCTVRYLQTCLNDQPPVRLLNCAALNHKPKLHILHTKTRFIVKTVYT